MSQNKHVPLEVKERLFALYQFQGIGGFESSKIGWVIGRMPNIEYINLKQVKNISQEDLLQIANIFVMEGSKDEQLLATKIILSHRCDIEQEAALIYNHNAQAIDYLRSKGYATDYLQYTVEDFIKMGWIKLID